MSRDEAFSGGLVLAFALLVTAHVTLVAGLASRPPRWRAVAALVVFPLAPWWGRGERMYGRLVVWLASAAAYAVLLWMASRP
jgi:hypothetical protein